MKSELMNINTNYSIIDLIFPSEDSNQYITNNQTISPTENSPLFHLDRHCTEFIKTLFPTEILYYPQRTRPSIEEYKDIPWNEDECHQMLILCESIKGRLLTDRSWLSNAAKMQSRLHPNVK